MILPDPKAPETMAAMAFMRHKGYDAQPLSHEIVEGEAVWYFYFEVPEGLVELEVEYGPVGDFPVDTWRCRVTEFWLYDEMPEDWSPASFVQQQLRAVEGCGG